MVCVCSGLATLSLIFSPFFSLLSNLRLCWRALSVAHLAFFMLVFFNFSLSDSSSAAGACHRHGAGGDRAYPLWTSRNSARCAFTNLARLPISAAHALPAFEAAACAAEGSQLLDLGCVSGTITVGFGELLAPSQGQVIGKIRSSPAASLRPLRAVALREVKRVLRPSEGRPFWLSGKQIAVPQRSVEKLPCFHTVVESMACGSLRRRGARCGTKGEILVSGCWFWGGSNESAVLGETCGRTARTGVRTRDSALSLEVMQPRNNWNRSHKAYSEWSAQTAWFGMMHRKLVIRT